jgi:hypothetical protein
MTSVPSELSVLMTFLTAMALTASHPAERRVPGTSLTP